MNPEELKLAAVRAATEQQIMRSRKAITILTEAAREIREGYSHLEDSDHIAILTHYFDEYWGDRDSYNLIFTLANAVFLLANQPVEL